MQGPAKSRDDVVRPNHHLSLVGLARCFTRMKELGTLIVGKAPQSYYLCDLSFNKKVSWRRPLTSASWVELSLAIEADFLWEEVCWLAMMEGCRKMIGEAVGRGVKS